MANCTFFRIAFEYCALGNSQRTFDSQLQVKLNKICANEYLNILPSLQNVKRVYLITRTNKEFLVYFPALFPWKKVKVTSNSIGVWVFANEREMEWSDLVDNLCSTHRVHVHCRNRKKKYIIESKERITTMRTSAHIHFKIHDEHRNSNISRTTKTFNCRSSTINNVELLLDACCTNGLLFSYGIF